MLESYCKEKLGPLTLRLALGLACVYHGYLKVAANGGTSWAAGLPTGWQFLIAWGELMAGLALVFGFRCRLAALAALAVNAWSFIWWQGWNGIHLSLRLLEPYVLVTLVAVSVLLLGAGGLSVDGRGGHAGGLSRTPKKK